MAAWRAHPHNMCASGRLEQCSDQIVVSSVLSRFEFAAPCARLCKTIWFTCVMSLKARCQSRPARFNLPGPSTSCDTFVCVHCRWQLFPTKGFRTHLLPAESKSRCSIWSRIAFHCHHETTGCLSIVAMKLETTPLTKSGTRSVNSEQKWGIEGAIWRVENPKELPKDPCSHCLIHIWAECKAATCNLQTQEIKDLTCLDAPPLSTHYAAFGTHVGTQAATKGCLW